VVETASQQSRIGLVLADAEFDNERWNARRISARTTKDAKAASLFSDAEQTGNPRMRQVFFRLGGDHTLGSKFLMNVGVIFSNSIDVVL